jgi:hypothetical protein
MPISQECVEENKSYARRLIKEFGSHPSWGQDCEGQNVELAPAMNCSQGENQRHD